MPARTGQQYLNGLREQEREVWLGGERVKDVTTQPGLAGGAQAIAVAVRHAVRPEATRRNDLHSPKTGDPLGLSFIIPRTREDLETRRVMMLNWARATCGMMGRSPDFMNVHFAAWAGGRRLFRAGQARVSARTCGAITSHIRENDLVLTHSLINLQRSRTVSGMFNLEEGTALQAVKETEPRAGRAAARGCWRRWGRFADEIAVYSPRLGRHTEGHSPFALSFSIPCGTPGLKFLCRDSFDHGRSHFDHPLGSRFEEMDCVVFFDDVLVPWERVFLYGDVDAAERRGAASRIHSAHHAHQGAAKNLAKCEFVLGIALLMTEALGNAHLPHIEERIGELMMYTDD